MRILPAVAFAMALTAATPYQDEIQRWRAQREAGLKADGGWLTVAGLFWLHEGANPYGTNPSNPVVLPHGTAPAQAGVFELRGGEVTAVANGTRLKLRPDSNDSVSLGSVQLFVIKRGDRYGIRMKDANSSFRKEFRGLHWFPVDPAYRITARFVSEPRKIPVLNVLGQTEQQDCPGYAEFTVAGKPVRLYAVLEPGAQQLFFIFRDSTSGRETYGAGRFLYAPMPQDGKVVLDFNRAYNPPCAFTPYATCPLPPKVNRLAVRIPAGELKYGDH
jgi:uncharacterized protein (DUF1684 family)